MMRILSPEFNAVVAKMASNVKYTLTRDQYGSFEEMKQDAWNRGGRFSVNTEHSSRTIFGDKRVNWMFRAWHDQCHLIANAGFDVQGEYAASQVQIQQMRHAGVSSPFFEALVDIEVNGQGQYFAETGQFPVDQYDFTVLHLQARGLKW
jgi:hypothetical protein